MPSRLPLVSRMMVAVAVTALAALAGARGSFAAGNDLADVQRAIAARHDEAVERLQEWIALPSIAAEDRNYPAGAEHMAQLLRDAGFQQADDPCRPMASRACSPRSMPARAKTVGLYFMYDVKQFDPAEWSSPPLEARLVDKPGLGKAIVGRGAVNQKGPEAAFLAALHAIRGAGRKMPVNLVLVAEGEEEIGSPHIGQLVHRPEVEAALRKCVGRLHAVCFPGPRRRRDGEPRRQGGRRARAGVERRDVGARARRRTSTPRSRRWSTARRGIWSRRSTRWSRPTATRSPIDDYPQPRPLSAEEKAMIAEAARRRERGAGPEAVSACSTGSTTCPGCRRTSGSSRSRRSTSRGWSAATPARAARPSCRTARWRRSTCGWCPT